MSRFGESPQSLEDLALSLQRVGDLAGAIAVLERFPQGWVTPRTEEILAWLRSQH